MPIARFQMPDGRVARFEVPEGTTPEQAQEMMVSAMPKSTIEPTSPVKIGKDAFPDALRQTLNETDWGTRNIAGAGTALSNLWEGAKQFVGKGNQQQIEANKIIEQEAPVGAFTGNAALTAIPFGMVGNGIKGAAAVGAGIGALQPVEGEQTASNVASGKAFNTGLGAVTGAGGQYVANKAGDWIANKLSSAALRKATDSVKNETLFNANKAGYVVPPSMAPTSGVTSRVLEGLSGKYKTNQLAGIRNQQVTDSLSRQAVGLAPDAPLTSEAMQAIRKEAFNKGYAPVAKAGTVTADDDFRAALDRVVGSYEGAGKDFPGIASTDVTDFINGKTVKAGVPERSVWVDGLGNQVEGFQMPQQPKFRNLLDEIKKAGGINPSELGDLNIDGLHKTYPGLVSKKGNSMDDLVEFMGQKGWLNDAAVEGADRSKTGGSHELAREMIRNAIDKYPVIHPSEGAQAFEYFNTLDDLAKQGINKVTIPGVQAETNGGLRGIQQFDAGNGIKMVQLLRDEAGEAFRKGDNALGKAKKEAAKIIEDQIERHLEKQGQNSSELLKGFRDARTLMAKAHTVEDAIKEGGGMVDAKALARRVQAGKPMSEELATAGKFANVFGDVAGIPKSGHANPFTALDFMQGGISAPLSMMAAGNPVGVAGALALPFARVASRYGLLSKPVQNALVRPDYSLPLVTRMTGGLLNYAPVGATAFGVPAFSK